MTPQVSSCLRARARAGLAAWFGLALSATIFTPIPAGAWTLSWTRTWPGDVDSFDANSLVVDGTGNVYVTAAMDGAAPAVGLAKFSPAGVLLWEKRQPIGATSLIPDPEVMLDSQGNVILTGFIYSESNSWDGRVTKFDPNGNELWSKTFDRNGDGNGMDELAIGPEDSVYVFGSVFSGAPGMWLVKYSSAGDEQWARELQTNFVGYPFGLAVGADGSAYALTNITTEVDYYGDDIILVKWASDGTREWIRSYDGPFGYTDDWPENLALDASGNVIVVGYSSDDANTRTTHGIVTLKYSPSGDLQWARRYDHGVFGDEKDLWYDPWPVALSIDDQANINVAGRNAGTGRYDFVTLRYDAQGTLAWSHRYEGPANCNDEASALVVGKDGDVLVAGTSEDGNCDVSSTPTSLAVAEYNASGVLQNVERRTAEGDTPVLAAKTGSGDVYVATGRELRLFQRVPAVPGPADALYDPDLQAPACVAVADACDSGEVLLDGRGLDGPELHQPNTIHGSSSDVLQSGGYHQDFGVSVDRLRVSTLDGQPFAAGKTVQIDATIWPARWGWNGGVLRLCWAADANEPVWNYIATREATSLGPQVLSATYDLPAGTFQAVRVYLDGYDVGPSCAGGGVDVDDLAFAVTPPPPTPMATQPKGAWPILLVLVLRPLVARRLVRHRKRSSDRA